MNIAWFPRYRPIFTAIPDVFMGFMLLAGVIMTGAVLGRAAHLRHAVLQTTSMQWFKCTVLEKNTCMYRVGADWGEDIRVPGKALSSHLNMDGYYNVDDSSLEEWVVDIISRFEALGGDATLGFTDHGDGVLDAYLQYEDSEIIHVRWHYVDHAPAPELKYRGMAIDQAAYDRSIDNLWAAAGFFRAGLSYIHENQGKPENAATVELAVVAMETLLSGLLKEFPESSASAAEVHIYGWPD